ncbi:hypothetical protein [Azonexus sp. R2A61]|uniref:hypothetical protein n=1 Tax=Azonexus sp. R2A61 TaxID=2744443 RepID=UPI001F427861|nr:hypothetical protein [Azonexus sp. R2A61]
MSDCFDCCLFSFLAGAGGMGLFVLATIVLDIGMDWIASAAARLLAGRRKAG